MSKEKRLKEIKELLKPKEPKFSNIWIVPCAKKVKDIGILGTVETYESTGEPNVLYAKIESNVNKDIEVKSETEAEKMLKFFKSK